MSYQVRTQTPKPVLSRIVISATIVIASLASVVAQSPSPPPPFGEAHVGGYDPIRERSLPVQVNSTYLLRSISHGRSDLLVGFRVTRQETDGSVIIAWKLLKKWKRPGFESVIHVNPIDKCPIK